MTRLEKVCVVIMWAAVLFSLVVTLGSATALANVENEPVRYDLEALETECLPTNPAIEQYAELIPIYGMCDVLVERLDQLGLLLDDQRMKEEFLGLVDAVEAGEVTVVNDDPLAVQEIEPLSMEMTEEAITAAGMAQREAIWAFAGLAVGLFAGYGMYRQVMPRG